ncbi:hypothetical protein VTJ04DRAFT_6630 [Mycothermus thermophilus]|uniref:uncharacterized protein n=1 Tax=Humicola insolens TaxID=85995 RepID=UPI0037440071
MQAVPTLVGSGTAAAAAAVGLVFGQPPESETPWSPPPPIHSPFPADYEPFGNRNLPPRPNTSAIPSYHPYPSPTDDRPYSPFRPLGDPGPSSFASPPMSPTSPISPTNIQRPLTSVSYSHGRRQSLARAGDLASQPIAENARDSVSSRESWIRRLSLRPLSQHGSRRSSLGPDSSSMTFSHGSGAPMLGQPPTTHTAPNKLVKRITSGPQGPADGMQRRGSQVLTLRRPATSHQRTATLQQLQQNQGTFSERPISPEVPGPSDNYMPTPTSAAFPPSEKAQGTSKWTSFFHARRSTSLGREFAGLPHGIFPRKRISVSWGSVYKAYLTKPDHIAEKPPSRNDGDAARDASVDDEMRHEAAQAASDASRPVNTPEPPADKPPRRSLSTHFSSASQWIARTGSARRSRRNTVDAKIGGSHFLPESGAVPRDQAYPPVSPGPEGFPVPPDARDPQHPDPTLKHQADVPRTRKRNSSSPVPPLRRLSSGFSIDVTRISSSTGPSRPLYSPPVNYPKASSTTTHSRGPSGERSITLAGSDASARETPFGDDEDTDFRSDGVFDSFRTGTSSTRMRSVETPIESMFDDSPPSSASHTRTKRLSIQEMLGPAWDGETKITEEEEVMPTPIKTAHLAEASNLVTEANGFGLDGTHEVSVSIVPRDFDRLSFFDDDDDDDDWARDDDNHLTNHLSPPSSTNSRRVSPELRHALRNISGSSTSSNPLQRSSMSDRPRSTIFDWVEPSPHDRSETDKLRPKTVHGKQELDLRGGRSAIRKPPGVAHVRSQSVPVVVPDSDGSKPVPKYGTWGTKKEADRWDGDFEFEGDDLAGLSLGGKDSATSVVVVPASIQATQPSVRAHSGQIRELSLLVNDLKRLCRHGKELDLLCGPLAAKWAEAESIIALASPDEEEDENISTKPSFDCDRPQTDELTEEGFDASFLDLDDAFSFPEPEMSKTAVVRERHSPKRRSVFSPDDDIFGGNWPLTDGSVAPSRPRTPRSRCPSPNRSSAVISTVIEVMKQHQQKSARTKNTPAAAGATRTPAPDTKLFFDTNSLQELVKRAGQLRDTLSDAVRRSELLTQSPMGTPRRDRDRRPNSRHHDGGSPAFTRVFVDPASTASTPPRQQQRLATSHSTPSILSRASIDSPRMQMMTAVN